MFVYPLAYLSSIPFFYILSIIDVCDCSIIGYHIGLQCPSEDAGHLVQRVRFKRE
ncbi:hypothetical protein [Bacillus cytotoxicus]|uniref:hypothetical protein n=1 Tax=Bacillus cytotoxicus TaxID=580165 RepID=UPI000A52DC53|nr:hypothetical protein [Bacillus cytotoxicus]